MTIGVVEAYHEGKFLQRGFASAWCLWELPVLDLQSSLVFGVLWNLQAKQTEVQIRTGLVCGHSISDVDVFLSHPAPLPFSLCGYSGSSLYSGLHVLSGYSLWAPFNVGKGIFLGSPLEMALNLDFFLLMHEPSET